MMDFGSPCKKIGHPSSRHVVRAEPKPICHNPPLRGLSLQQTAPPLSLAIHLSHNLPCASIAARHRQTKPHPRRRQAPSRRYMPSSNSSKSPPPSSASNISWLSSPGSLSSLGSFEPSPPAGQQPSLLSLTGDDSTSENPAELCEAVKLGAVGSRTEKRFKTEGRPGHDADSAEQQPLPEGGEAGDTGEADGGREGRVQCGRATCLCAEHDFHSVHPRLPDG